MFFDMPLNSLPPVTDAQGLALKRAAGGARVAHGLSRSGGHRPRQRRQARGAARRGGDRIKAFMCNSGVDEFPAADAATLRAGMKRAAALGMLVAVHAEDEALARLHVAEQHARGTDVRTWLASRPIELEKAAIRTAVDIAGETGCALHIVHVSSPEGVALARQARAAGARRDGGDLPPLPSPQRGGRVRLGAPAKCFPPLRRRPYASGYGRRWRTG